METNNQLLHDIVGIDREVPLTNNQLLKIWLESLQGS